jgi:hypothetical protein
MSDFLRNSGGGVVEKFKDMGDGSWALVVAMAGGFVAVPGWSSQHVTGAGATYAAIKTGAGTLHSVSINKLSVGGTGLTLYDSLTGTGTVLAVIDTTAALTTLLYDLAFSTGLTAVQNDGGTTHADVTIAYA